MPEDSRSGEAEDINLSIHHEPRLRDSWVHRVQPIFGAHRIAIRMREHPGKAANTPVPELEGDR